MEADSVINTSLAERKRLAEFAEAILTDRGIAHIDLKTRLETALETAFIMGRARERNGPQPEEAKKAKARKDRKRAKG